MGGVFALPEAAHSKAAAGKRMWSFGLKSPFVRTCKGWWEGVGARDAGREERRRSFGCEAALRETP